jgi:hypothetical protein
MANTQHDQVHIDTIEVTNLECIVFWTVLVINPANFQVIVDEAWPKMQKEVQQLLGFWNVHKDFEQNH